MNSKQVVALSAGLLFIALCSFFPPRKFVVRLHSIVNGTPARGTLLSSNLNEDGQATIDTGRLLAECLCISALTGVAVLNMAGAARKTSD